jgi:hypothetical protein
VSTPRFNHVAFSVPATALDDAGRADILGFYGEVFGWEEMPTMTKPGAQLVLQAYSYDQFVFVVAEDEPMACPRTDHFGMSVDTLDELTTFHDRAERYAARDDRVNVSAVGLEDYEVLKLSNFYVHYLLPLSIEVQHWEWT